MAHIVENYDVAVIGDPGFLGIADIEMRLAVHFDKGVVIPNAPEITPVEVDGRNTVGPAWKRKAFLVGSKLDTSGWLFRWPMM